MENDNNRHVSKSYNISYKLLHSMQLEGLGRDNPLILQTLAT
jgi:hypothetical protein